MNMSHPSTHFHTKNLIPQPLLLKEKGRDDNEFPLLEERVRVRWKNP
jgi:hypothetical protein